MSIEEYHILGKINKKYYDDTNCVIFFFRGPCCMALVGEYWIQKWLMRKCFQF